MDYLFYSLFGGAWPLIVIIGFIYFAVKISRLAKRVSELESRPLGNASRGIEAGVVESFRLAPSPAPTPAPAPAPTPAQASGETQEETSARWLGWVGAVMLLLGVSFFLKYAFDNEWIGPTGQVALGILAGLAAIGIGQKLRAKYLNYSDLIMGAGVGILYFSIYAGFAFYDPVVLSQTLAFALMVLVTALAMVIAVMGNTMGIAILGVLGGFLTPVLLSTGENHLVTLSLYMMVLNVGVLGVSWFTKWVKLNYLTFIGTVILFGGWMDHFYWSDPDGQLTMTFLFLTAFFVIFLANSILHHLVRKEASTSGDLVLLFLNAMGYFGVCYSILDPRHHDILGFFALLLAVLYLGVSYLAYAREEHDRTLNLTLPGIAVVFLSLAIPLQLTGYWISVAWLVESLVLVYVGLFIKEKPIQVFGWIVLTLGMVSMLSEVEKIRSTALGGFFSLTQPEALTPVMNTGFILLALGIAVFYVLTWLYAKDKDGAMEWKKIASLFVILANLLTIYALTTEITQKYRTDIARVNRESQVEQQKQIQYGGLTGYSHTQSADSYALTRALRNRSDTAVSVLWALYATLLLVVGFMKRVRVLRLFGLIFFFITACRVFIYAWELGPIYRILSTIAFGVIALSAAFLYAKYKHRIKEIILQ